MKDQITEAIEISNDKPKYDSSGRVGKKRAPYKKKNTQQFNSDTAFQQPVEKIATSIDDLNIDELLGKYSKDAEGDIDSNSIDVSTGEENVIHGQATAIQATGETLIMLIDTIVPILASIVIRLLVKKKIPMSEFELTEDEKKILLPYADAAAGEVLGKINHTAMFFTMLGIIVGKKVMPYLGKDK